MNNKELDDLFEKARNTPQQFDTDALMKHAKSMQPKPEVRDKSILYRILTYKSVIILIFTAISLSILTLLNENDNTSLSQNSENGSTNTVTHSKNQNSNEWVEALNDANTNVNDNDNKTENDSLQVRNVRPQNLTVQTLNLPLNLKGNVAQLLKVQSEPSQFYTISALKDTVLRAKQNTLFHIEGLSFVDKNNRIQKDSIRIEIKECYDLFSFLRENLSTSGDSGLLQSVGMLYFNAYKGNDTLKLRPGYEVGICPNYEVEDRMDLYKGTRDEQQNISWQRDPLGRMSSPLLMVTGGKYRKVLDTFFYKNFRIEKSDMVNLTHGKYYYHFTTQERQLIGNFSCNKDQGPEQRACQWFNSNLSPQLAKMDIFPPQSRLTQFEFTCMSKNEYAYGMKKGNIDSFKLYVPPSDYHEIDKSFPVFFASGLLGWHNIDCVPRVNLHIKWKKSNIVEKTSFKVMVPEELSANSYLILHDINALDRKCNNTSNYLEFDNIISNSKATLVVTAFYEDAFYVFKETFVVGEKVPVVEFKTIADGDEYLEWLKSATQMVEN
jgi:hypothetical protein